MVKLSDFISSSSGYVHKTYCGEPCQVFTDTPNETRPFFTGDYLIGINGDTQRVIPAVYQDKFGSNTVVSNGTTALILVDTKWYAADANGVIDLWSPSEIDKIVITKTLGIAILHNRTVLIVSLDTWTYDHLSYKISQLHCSDNLILLTDSKRAIMYNEETKTHVFLPGLVRSVLATTHTFTLITCKGAVYVYGDSRYTGLSTDRVPVDEPVVQVIRSRRAGAALTSSGKVFVWGNVDYGGVEYPGYIDLPSIQNGYTSTNMVPELGLGIIQDAMYLKQNLGKKLYATDDDMFFETTNGSLWKWTPKRKAIDLMISDPIKVVHGVSRSAVITADNRLYSLGPNDPPRFIVANVSNVAVSFRRCQTAVEAFAALSHCQVYVWGDPVVGGTNEEGVPGFLKIVNVTDIMSNNGVFVASSNTAEKNHEWSTNLVWGDTVPSMQFTSIDWTAIMSNFIANTNTLTIMNDGVVFLNTTILNSEAVSHESGGAILDDGTVILVGERYIKTLENEQYPFDTENIEENIEENKEENKEENIEENKEENIEENKEQIELVPDDEQNNDEQKNKKPDIRENYKSRPCAPKRNWIFLILVVMAVVLCLVC